MIINDLTVGGPLVLLVAMELFGAERTPETVKEAILRGVDISRGHRVFARDGWKDGTSRSIFYLPVDARGTRVADGSVRVVFSAVQVGKEPKVADVLRVEFSRAGVRTDPPRRAPVTPGSFPEDERRVCDAVKAVLSKYLNAGQSDIAVSVCVQDYKTRVCVGVADIPIHIPGHWLFVVNEKNEVKRLGAPR